MEDCQRVVSLPNEPFMWKLVLCHNELSDVVIYKLYIFCNTPYP